ncbi:MAG: ribosome-associated translation inhibitor RaiA [Ignavibacteria bacterium]|nr:ribosome-associated translation inhibitor RaiA [Ignavibacteria bacterium]
MTTTVTSRHFKAHGTLVDYAKASVEKLDRFYDGIIKCEVKLSFEKSRNSVKIAEIIVTVYKSRLTGVARTEDFHKSIDAASEKVLVQLKKYKDRLRNKDRIQVRRVRAKV